jgi:DNA-binding response OmpR family regulator
VKVPTRALVVEDTESWVFTLSRAAREAGASELVVCDNLQAVRQELRRARFDIAVLDIGLDPNDDVNADGVAVLNMIRETDGDGTGCVLVTGWQGGDRMALQAEAQEKYGVDWAYMKEHYDADALIAKLTELLEQAAEHHRRSPMTPMGNLSGSMEAFLFEANLLKTISPSGGVRTLYSAAASLVGSAAPLVPMYPDSPMKVTPDGFMVGLYWSRALATAVAVALASVDAWPQDDGDPVENLGQIIPAGVIPGLIERVRDRNVLGWLWKLPDCDRDSFTG